MPPSEPIPPEHTETANKWKPVCIQVKHQNRSVMCILMALNKHTINIKTRYYELNLCLLSTIILYFSNRLLVKR